MILFSDLHIHNYSQYSVPTKFPGINSRALDGLNVLRYILHMGLDNHVDTIFAGDMYVPRDSLDIALGVATYKLLEEYGVQYKAKGLKIIFVPGNHDRYSKAGDIIVLEMFKHIPGVVVVTRPMGVVTSEGTILCIPCRDSLELLMEDILKYKDISDTLVTHTPIYHARLPKGYKLEEGLRTKKLSKYFKWAFFGDTHQYQEVRKGFYIVGPPMHHSFEDEGSNRGILEFNGKSVNFKSFFGMSPCFRTVTHKGPKVRKVSIVKGDFVRYISHVVLSSKQKRIIRKWYGESVVIQEVVKPERKESALKGISVMSSLDKIMKAYLNWGKKEDLLQYDGKNLDVDTLKGIMEKVL